jgi:hypothetical protein
MVPAARFPLAEACANPECQRFVVRDQADPNEGKCDRCSSPSAKRGRWPTFQTAVVLACPQGHLADVPWDLWLHGRPGGGCTRSELKYSASNYADRPKVSCRGCGRSENFDPTETFPCTGARPWLPGAGPEPCTEKSRPLERTSAATYYAFAPSSLTIPVAGADNPALVQALGNNAILRTLARLTRSQEVVAQIVTVANRVGIPTDASEVLQHLTAIDADPATAPSRDGELRALSSHEHPRRVTGALPDLIVEPQDIKAYRNSQLGQLLAGVSLVPRLRETRVLAGFSRIEPEVVDPGKGYAQLWGRERPREWAPGAKDDWLPGYRVFGEGILFELDNAAVEEWAKGAARQPRVLTAAKLAQDIVECVSPIGALLAHTLAHLVMRTLAPHCGYSLPSIRERIFSVEGRTAFLVYTASGDVHGTLGGLVELGTADRLGPLLDTAMDTARWCATDPVCGEDTVVPRRLGSLPGACHHCLLVPETSCELFNQGLDRAVVHGTDVVPGFLQDG